MPIRCETDVHVKLLAAQATCGPFWMDCFPNVSIGFPVVCVWFFSGFLCFLGFSKFPYAVLWYSYDLPTVFSVVSRRSYVFRMVFTWFSFGFPMVGLLFQNCFVWRFPTYVRWFSMVSVRFSYVFPLVSVWFSYDALFIFICFSTVPQCNQNRCQTDAHLNVLAAQATCGPFRVDCFPNVSNGFPMVAVWFFYGVSMYS